MPTIESKNVAIAEMLGGWLEAKEQPNPYWEGIYTDKPYAQTKDLKFHSDANWQFEALEFIENLNKGYSYYTRIDTNRCNIGVNTQWAVAYNEIVSIHTKEKSKLLAIFEALYQFSLYIKQKENDNNNASR